MDAMLDGWVACAFVNVAGCFFVSLLVLRGAWFLEGMSAQSSNSRVIIC